MLDLTPGKVEFDVFELISMTPEQDVGLCVAFRGTSEHGEWGWQVRETGDSRFPEIVIGPREPTTRGVLPRAIYRWKPARSAYTGPEGGTNQDFLRVDKDDIAALKAFARHAGMPGEEDEDKR